MGWGLGREGGPGLESVLIWRNSICSVESEGPWLRGRQVKLAACFWF